VNKQYYVYILSNETNTVIYTGVTNDLKRRAFEHKEKKVEGFTKKYNVSKLVYYEAGQDVMGAIFREKQIKGMSRLKKNELISQFNPYWSDLYEDI
jgi:putative endonuclease